MTCLSVHLFGSTYANPFMNAAGVLCSTAADLQEMSSSESGSLVTKSCTLAPREGNPEPRYQALPLGSINSMGLPNLGFDFYAQYASHRHDYKSKPLFVSVSGLSVEENVVMCTHLKDIAASHTPGMMLELNLSCPNVPGKPQIAYDFDAMRQYLDAVSKAYGRPFGVKLSPYFDMTHFDMAAEVLNGCRLLTFITCVNSIGNGLVIDPTSETVVIKPKKGFGGLGGKYILPTALANVRAFYERCPDKHILGCGGVYTGEDAFLHILSGASMVQVGSALHEEGTAIFARLIQELKAIMQKKGYRTLDEFRGKLKVMA